MTRRLFLALIISLILGAVNVGLVSIGSIGSMGSVGSVGSIGPVVYAGEYEDLVKEKEKKKKEREEKEKEAEETEVKKQSLGSQLVYYKEELAKTEATLRDKRQLILEIEQDKKEREEERSGKISQRNQVARALYKSTQMTPLELFIGADSFSALAQAWGYHKAFVNEGKRQIAEINNFIEELSALLSEEEQKRVALEEETAVLAGRTVTLNRQIGETESYLEELKDQISSLEEDIVNITQRQEELIREKLAATAVFTSVGESEEAKQVLPDPGFSPAYAVFSFGRPHRVGMNQYGAYGRAKDGQDYEEILEAYYKDIDIVEYDVPEDITIITGDGNEEINFEENYLMGIAEMPSFWGDKGGFEALKAQAIAARTYALAVTNDGAGAICITQSCQVYRASKVNSDAAVRWHEAVEETRSLVIVYGGVPIKAWYASTAGGYTRLPTDFDVKWNYSPPYVKRVVDLDDEGRPFDGPEYGDSPWFHKVWYVPSDDGHPWLTEEEILDLLNAAQLPDSYNEHLSQEEKGGWSKGEVLEALEDEDIEPIEEITDIKSVFSEEGCTMFLRIDTDGGYVDIDGRRFRQIFILRSRGYLALWSSLYDVVIR